MGIVLIVVSGIGVLLYGYFLMDKLDDYLNGGGFSGAPQAWESKGILIFSDLPDKMELQPLLQAASYSHAVVDSPALPPRSVYRAVFALSANDLDNILLCMLAQKAHSTVTVALCNDKQYLRIFQEYPIDKVVLSMEEAFMALLHFQKRQGRKVD